MKAYLWVLALLLTYLLQVGCGSQQPLSSPSTSPAADSPRDELATYVAAVQPAVNMWAESRSIEEVAVVLGTPGSRLPQSEIHSMLKISDLRGNAARDLAEVKPPKALLAAHGNLVRGLRLSSKEWALNAGAASQGVPFSDWYTVRHKSRFETPFYRAAQRWDLAVTTAADVLNVSVPFRIPEVMRSKVVN